MNDYLLPILLGFIEGLTEFIPVSSTGHLIVFIDILGFNAPPGKVFEIVIQLGAILAVCWLYRETLWQSVVGAIREVFVSLPTDSPALRSCNLGLSTGGAGGANHESDEQRVGGFTKNRPHLHFLLTLLIAFLPAAIIGVFAHGFIKEVLFSPQVVAVMLVVGGIAILIIERYKPQPRIMHAQRLSYKTALLVGLCQSVAMIPGTSRSGATIMGGLLLGLDRKAATEFSFFLAIPTMFGATAYDIYKNWHYLSLDNIGVIALGFGAAFISALLVVRWVIGFISRRGFAPFAYYRIALGSVMIAYFMF